MRNIIFILLFFSGQVINCQDFVFNLYFQDFKGNKDTIAIGYDRNATDTIDLNQNEKNIINEPLNTKFDVRISNIWMKKYFGLNAENFQTKRQIVSNNCGSRFPAVTIDVLCKNWPVTITWDSTQFANECNIGSLLTSFHPGGWFDVGGGFVTVLSKRSNMIMFNSYEKYTSYRDITQYYYINNKNDTISVFWQAFGDIRLPHSNVNQINNDLEFSFFPNPSKEKIFLSGNIDAVKEIEVYNSLGIKVLTTNKNELNLKHLSFGVYYAVIKLKNNNNITRKIIYE